MKELSNPFFSLDIVMIIKILFQRLKNLSIFQVKILNDTCGFGLERSTIFDFFEIFEV